MTAEQYHQGLAHVIHVIKGGPGAVVAYVRKHWLSVGEVSILGEAQAAIAEYNPISKAQATEAAYAPIPKAQVESGKSVNLRMGWLPRVAAAGLLAILAEYTNGSVILRLDDPNVTILNGETAVVGYHLLNGADPIVGEPMSLGRYVRETGLGDPFICDDLDIQFPSELSVLVSSPTDLLGRGSVTITHGGSPNIGNYHFEIFNGLSAMDSDALATGDIHVIPEPGTLSYLVAGLMLLATAKSTEKRKEK